MSVGSQYNRLAAHYDGFVGYEQFRQARRIFEHCVRTKGLCFSRVADFGCGTGLFAQHLASDWGVPVYAIDRSPQMLDIAAHRCHGLNCSVLLRDYQDLVLPQPVEMITMFSFTLNLAESSDALADVVDSAWRNLMPGGTWIVDFLTPRQRVTVPPDGGGVHARMLSARQGHFCLGIGIRSSRRAALHEERHCATLLPPIDLRNRLDRRGFVLIDAIDHATLGPAQHVSPALVFVVRKPCRAQC